MSSVRLDGLGFYCCQCYLCVHLAVLSHHIKIIADGEQAIHICHEQLSNSWIVDCCGWEMGVSSKGICKVLFISA